MHRRSFIFGLATAGAGGAAWIKRDTIQGLAEEKLETNFGPPATETPIKEFGGDRYSFLASFTLYESGAARFTFDDDYGCFARLAVGDSSGLRQGDRLATWDLPEDGELVVDMKAAVQDTHDPSNTFVLESIADSDSYCFGTNAIDERFEVPEDWL